MNLDEGITVNFKNKDFIGIFAHEAKHAEDALKDSTNYLRSHYTEAEKTHNDRHYEKKANDFAKKVQEEQKKK